MDPLSQPPTRNNVVQEMMVWSLKVADEMKQKYAIVTYDLAVAQKAYAIQSLKVNLLLIFRKFPSWNGFLWSIGNSETVSEKKYGNK